MTKELTARMLAWLAVTLWFPFFSVGWLLGFAWEAFLHGFREGGDL